MLLAENLNSPNKLMHRMLGNNISLKFERRDMPLIGDLSLGCL